MRLIQRVCEASGVLSAMLALALFTGGTKRLTADVKAKTACIDTELVDCPGFQDCANGWSFYCTVRETHEQCEGTSKTGCVSSELDYCGTRWDCATGANLGACDLLYHFCEVF